MDPGGPAHKRQRLDGTKSHAVWNDRRLHTIKLDPKTSKTPDLGHGPFAVIKNLLRIRKDDSASGTMKPAIARVSAEHSDIAGCMELVSRFRSSLEELVSYKNVYFDTANNHWLVDIGHINPGYHAVNLPLKIGRCPVYVCDSREPYPYIPGMWNDSIEPISPLHICSDTQLREIAKLFPHSIGMRVHKWGHIDILFESKKKIRQSLDEATIIPGSLGGLHWGRRVLEIRASASNTSAGVQVAAKEDEYANVLGCIGLRSQKNGEEKDSRTTTTHAWLKQPMPRPRNLLANVVTLMRGSKVLSATVDVLRDSEVEGRRSQSVLGTDVFVAGTRVKVGSITKCYDPLPLPDSRVAFPLGLDHDLSLITGDDLPTMSLPPNFPILQSSFADPEEALQAPDVFLTRFNVRFDRWDTFAGHAVTGSARDALVVGMDYFWEQRHVKVKRALIWRTEIDDHSVTGASGSTLCLGVPSALTCKAVLFQNYESMFQQNSFWTMDRVRSQITGGPARASFKGGFLLPADVRTAKIIIEDDSPRRRSVSGPGAASAATGSRLSTARIPTY